MRGGGGSLNVNRKNNNNNNKKQYNNLQSYSNIYVCNNRATFLQEVSFILQLQNKIQNQFKNKTKQKTVYGKIWCVGNVENAGSLSACP